MGEEVGSDEAVTEWEDGLPGDDDLTPLTQSLLPPELASAFKISPEPLKTAVDVHRASQSTVSSLCSTNNPDPDPDPKKARRANDVDEDEDEEDQSTAAGGKSSSKKARLVWTPELHKRFIEVVAYLGLKNAVPKTIMQMMNVDGLTRENVASHLQKYRLYMRRQGYSDDDDGPPQQSSVADSSNGGNNNTNSNNHGGMPIPMPYHHHHPQMMQMMMSSNGHGFHTYNHHNHHQQKSYWSGSSSKYNNQ